MRITRLGDGALLPGSIVILAGSVAAGASAITDKLAQSARMEEELIETERSRP